MAAALRSKDEAKRLFLEAYVAARENKWTIIIMGALVSFTEMEVELLPETKLAVALSVISNPSVTPHLRTRCEHIRDETVSHITADQIEAVENYVKQKAMEDLAMEVLN